MACEDSLIKCFQYLFQNFQMLKSVLDLKSSNAVLDPVFARFLILGAKIKPVSEVKRLSWKSKNKIFF